MIYVIKVEYRECTLVKIGYTEDMNKERRFSQYRMHNPLCEVLYELSEGTTDDETNLHYHFGSLKFRRSGSNFKEWFYYSEDIDEFFKENDTIEKVRRSILEVDKKLKVSELKEVLWPFDRALRDVLGRSVKEELYQFCYTTDEGKIIDWICSIFPDLAGMIIQEYDDLKEKTSEKRFKDFIETLRDTKVSIPVRLKSLCETEDFTEEEKKIIAQQASELFDKYYNLIGPKRCKALGYDSYLLRRELSNLLVDQDSIRSEMHLNFIVGNKYQVSEIKEKLSAIYNKLHLNKNPKATDLEDYFLLKRTKTLDSSGNRVSCLEILGII